MVVVRVQMIRVGKYCIFDGICFVKDEDVILVEQLLWGGVGRLVVLVLMIDGGNRQGSIVLRLSL